MYNFDNNIRVSEVLSSEQPATEKSEIDEEAEKTGTTTVGLVAGDEVVVATDRQTSFGHLVSSKSTVKIDKVHPRGVITTCGISAHAQRVSEKIEAQNSLFEARRGRNMTISQLAKAVSKMLERRFLLVRPIVAGVDSEGGHVLALDSIGSISSDPFKATGSGTTMAYGVLEDQYYEDISVEEAKEVASSAVISATERDVSSGGGLVLSTISTDGVDIQTFDYFPEKDEL